MASCRSCARGLDPSWKFCVYCGTSAATVQDAARVGAVTEAPGTTHLPTPALVSSMRAEAQTGDAEPYAWTSAQPAAWPGERMHAAVPSAIRSAAAVPDRPFSALAIAAFALSLVGFAPAFVLGHIALSRVRAHGLRGGGLALAATIIGYVLLVVWVAALAAAAVWLLRSEPLGTIQQASALPLMRP